MSKYQLKNKRLPSYNVGFDFSRLVLVALYGLKRYVKWKVKIIDTLKPNNRMFPWCIVKMGSSITQTSWRSLTYIFLSFVFIANKSFKGTPFIWSWVSPLKYKVSTYKSLDGKFRTNETYRPRCAYVCVLWRRPSKIEPTWYINK